MPDHRLIQATCPDCRGPLSEVTENGVREIRCLVGHRYSHAGALHAHSETEERALWSAVLVLEEAAILAREVAGNIPGATATLMAQAKEKQRLAGVVRGVLDQLRPFVID